MYNGRAALSCSMNLFPTENYCTAATKHVISSMQRFCRDISEMPTSEDLKSGDFFF